MLFETYYITLTYLSEKPQAQSNRDATGIVLAVLINASLLVWITGTTMLLTYNAPNYNRLSDPTKLCGPYPDLVAWQEPFWDWLEAT